MNPPTSLNRKWAKVQYRLRQLGKTQDAQYIKAILRFFKEAGGEECYERCLDAIASDLYMKDETSLNVQSQRTK